MCSEINRSTTWKFLHSLWIVLTFIPFASANFLAFLYVGFSARKRSWKLYGIIYFIIDMLCFSIVNNALGVLGLLSVWIFSIVHAFKIRKKFLIRLDVIKSYDAAVDDALRKKENDSSTYVNEKEIGNSVKKKNLDSFEQKVNAKEEENGTTHHHIKKRKTQKFTLNRTERSLRNEIRRQIYRYPSSLHYFYKIFKEEGTIHHTLLISFKDKICGEIKSQDAFEHYKDADIYKLIEDELKSIIMDMI